MKKTKLLKLLTVSSLSIVTVIVPLVTTLTGCNEPNTTSIKEVTASNGKTKIALLDNIYNLKNSFDTTCIKELKNTNKTSIFASMNYIKNIYDEDMTYSKTNYAFFSDTIYLTNNDFFNFLNLFKIDNRSISYITFSNKSEEYSEYPGDFRCYVLGYENPKNNENFLYWFDLINLNVNEQNKSLSCNLVLGKYKMKKNYNSPILWIADLGEFTFSNAME